MQNNVLVINCGSSSLKFSLIDGKNEQTLLSGLAEKLGQEGAQISVKDGSGKSISPLTSPFNHQSALSWLVAYLSKQQLNRSISAIGHRVVHGGESYSQPTLITQAVKDEIKQLSTLAPLHNPANLVGIEAAQASFNKIPHVAVFDTAFHQTLAEQAYLYAIPISLYQKHGIRKYGFHGTSHYFVANQAAKIQKKPLTQCNVISAHLGNGCSITAIKDGQSVETSLGLTPLAGVAMGTRSGDIDPGIIFHLIEQLGYTSDEVNHMLNKNSGLLGLSQLSNDCRELEQAASDGNKDAALALDIFAYRIAKTIASMFICFDSLDGLIFTGGIGENSNFVRAKILNHLSILGVEEDSNANQAMRFGEQGNIATSTSLPCWVIPTNEEYVIAMQTLAIKNGEKD